GWTERARLGAPPLHERPAADLARDQAALLRFSIGFRNGPDAEIEALCHVALGQQAHAGLDAAGSDIGLQRIDKSEIARAWNRGESRYPVGHNLVIRK